MPWSVESLSPQCSDLAELPAGHSQGASGQCAHVVLSLAYRGQHRSSGHLNPHAFLLLPISLLKRIVFTAHLIWV